MIFERLKKIALIFGSWKKRPLPAFYQWRQFFKVLKRGEKIAFSIFVFLALSSAIFLTVNFYFQNTEVSPAKSGVYIEGIIGQPRLINPIYAQANDVDRDLVELLFVGLMKYNFKGGIVPDLAEEYPKIEDGGRVYEFYLKENLFWSDGKEFSVDDIIYTIEIIQDPNYQSPLRGSLLGVEVERISNQGIRFKLKNPYPSFLETLTLKILPKHIWQEIPPQNFHLAVFNLEPVGNGPFQFKKKSLTKDKLGHIKSLKLIPNPNYHRQLPFLSEISFYFFETEKDLIKAWQKKEIKGISAISPKNSEILKKERAKIYQLSFLRYFDVSFNLEKSKILAEKEVRVALNYGTNKEEIVREVLADQGKIVHSPFLSEISGFPPPSKIYQFDLEKGKEILEKAGWIDVDQDGQREKIIKKEVEILFKKDLKLGAEGEEVRKLQTCLAKDPEVYPEGEITGYFGAKTKRAVIRFQEKYAKDILEPWGFKKGTGIVSKTTRAKLNEICGEAPKEILPLEFSLVTVNQEEILEVANLLKNQWRELGVELEIKKVDLSTLQQDFLKPRNYESLLFGKVVGLVPDPFPFWHSSQRKDPGLNLAMYQSEKADKLLEEARQTLNPEERKEKYIEFQEILIEDAPVVFLYSPDYLYPVSEEIKGISARIIADPSKRFVGVEEWYIKTKRVWK